MKKIIVSIFILIFVLSLVSAVGVNFNEEGVSCSCNENCHCNFDKNKKTVVLGEIYDASSDEPIKHAFVNVACEYEGNIVEKSTKSKHKGFYFVIFNKNQCGEGAEVIVTAEKDGLYGSAEGTVEEGMFKWNVAIIRVPLVPEFGLIVGVLTIFSAMVVFFVIRREGDVSIK